jgi:hypothetical protein
MLASPGCARPGCGGVLAAWLTYDYGGRTVWLDSPDAEPDGTSLALCPAHADGLRVPRGWTCRDRRVVPPAGGDPVGPAPGPPRPAVAV